MDRRITQFTKDFFVDKDASLITYMDFGSQNQGLYIIQRLAMASDLGIDGLRDVNLVRAESSAILGTILARSLDSSII